MKALKQEIWYAGVLCKFEEELNNTDIAQNLINYYKKLGYKACCLHEKGKHQLYVEIK